MTWRTLFLDVRSGLFVPRLLTWDPETGEFTCVDGPKGSRRGRKPHPQRPCRDFCSLQHVLFRAFGQATWLPEDSDPTDPQNGLLELFQTPCRRRFSTR